MTADSQSQVTVFEDGRRIATGTLAKVTADLWRRAREGALLVAFDEEGRRVDIDPREPSLQPPPARGRPKLGVVPREVTLLPRHWDWLSAQPGGASVALRKLVEGAMRSPEANARQSREAASRFMTVMGGDLPTYEEATRALFAADRRRFEALTDGWPADIRDHARALAGPSFG